MVGHLNNIVVNDVQRCFQVNCLVLIGEAYNWLKHNKNISPDWDEESISANLVTHINNSEKAIKWNISISDECRLYNQAILDNQKSAKSAPRIDLKFTSCNWSQSSSRMDFFAEAKNLIENNCKKRTNKNLLQASRIQKRYIDTGIDNFKQGNYQPNGCMLGYVLEGSITNIIASINSLLCDADRNNETLAPIESEIPFIDNIYFSTHSKTCSLNHYFLCFSS